MRSVLLLGLAAAGLSACHSEETRQQLESMDNGGAIGVEVATTTNEEASALAGAAPTETVDKAALDRATKALYDEKAVRNVDYRPADVVQWTVAVDSDGTPRHGFASYLCTVIAQAGAMTPATAVRVSDAKLQADNGETSRDASLGAVKCATDEHLDEAPALQAAG